MAIVPNPNPNANPYVYLKFATERIANIFCLVNVNEDLAIP